MQKFNKGLKKIIIFESDEGNVSTPYFWHHFANNDGRNERKGKQEKRCMYKNTVQYIQDLPDLLTGC